MSGREGADTGVLREKLLVTLLNMDPHPAWLFKASRTENVEMDQRGLDVEVLTDVGSLYIQVKSSQADARTFRKKYKERGTAPVGVVILQAWKDPTDIRKQAMAILHDMRKDALEKKSKLLYYLPKHWMKINNSGEYGLCQLAVKSPV